MAHSAALRITIVSDVSFFYMHNVIIRSSMLFYCIIFADKILVISIANILMNKYL